MVSKNGYSDEDKRKLMDADTRVLSPTLRHACYLQNKI